MKPLEKFTKKDWKTCHWRGAKETFLHLAISKEKTQSQKVVRPLHWYIACRLVIEGGFLPDQIKPRPPFKAVRKGRRWLLSFDQDTGGGGEATVLGGLKTKDVDIVVQKSGIGPVIAISCKCIGGAFRNLTNRMEEAIGECTNLHMTYTALVTGYFFVFRGHRAGMNPDLTENDVAILQDGRLVDGIIRYHEAFRNLEGRTNLRDTISKYEAVALSILETSGPDIGSSVDFFPPVDSPLRAERFFETIYRRYDERFVFSAPLLAKNNVTPRVEWAADSPLFNKDLLSKDDAVPELDYAPRVSGTLEALSPSLREPT
ncbi:MAG: hypothetical protein OYH76_17675 [Defluviicoccus sp.]|nr:hypothetical protein [Defluviicoccus sp.]MDE0277728.1 hypothetical protein [Defluviicoccus sp.]